MIGIIFNATLIPLMRDKNHFEIICGLSFLILKPLEFTFKTQLKHGVNDLWFTFIILKACRVYV